MQIEYSGRYKKLLKWAELKEQLFAAIAQEDDSIILEAVRTEIIAATTSVYERVQQLKREADEANAYYDSAAYRAAQAQMDFDNETIRQIKIPAGDDANY